LKNPSTPWPRLIGAAVLVLAAGGLGFFASRARHAPKAETSLVRAGTPAQEGATEAQAPPAQSQRKVPATLPEITLADKDGKPTRLASFAGRPLMVNFWATWCAPCRREIPLLNRISQERKAQNAEIVGIAVDFREDVLKFLQTTPLHYPLLIGEEDGLAAAEAFGMGMAFPFSVFVDSQGRILTLKVGELHEDEANFAFDRLRDIDQGTMTLQAAQAAVAEAFRTMAADRARTETAAGAKSS
jgi:thiol-disulfide isomerase/thioredoxin